MTSRDGAAEGGRMAVLAARGAGGGVLMGLANLVPGISGGTMLLAAGVYTAFVNAIAEVTTLRFRARSLVVLGSVMAAAAAAIVLLAGTVKGLVVDHRWAMYSLFVGLTLGGVPVIWRMVGRPTRDLWAAAGFGFAAMAALAWVQQRGIGTGGEGAGGAVMLVLAGAAGASAMILPGVSGGYLLLVLGQYVPILGAIDDFKEALRAGDAAAAMSPALGVGLPVGIGVAVGIVGVSNLLRYCLRRFEKATLGALLGLLLGAVVGLWPFQQGVKPAVGDVVKGRVVTEQRLAELEPEDYPTRFFRPKAAQAGGAAGLLLAGLGVTLVVAFLGREKNDVRRAGGDGRED